MLYFVLYDANQNIIGFLASDHSPSSPYYEEVSAEDFVSLGGVIPNIQQTPTQLDTLEDAICSLDAAYSERLASVEDALCELDKEETV